MYKNSKARIKLLNRVSDKIDILVGTEQGHPMSPELFKLYIMDLSDTIKNIETTLKLPTLNDHNLSHLLWADDLVLIALDSESLQKLINVLSKFCEDWDIVVKMTKTEIMVFNSTGRILNESNQLQGK